MQSLLSQFLLISLRQRSLSQKLDFETLLMSSSPSHILMQSLLSQFLLISLRQRSLSQKLDFETPLMSSSPENKARLLSALAPHASAWLSVAPSAGLNLHLHSLEFQNAVRWWLGLDTSFASVCPFCPGLLLTPLVTMLCPVDMVVTQSSDTTNCVTSLQIYVARHTCLSGWKQDMVCVVITITLVQQTSLWRVGREANLLP